MSDLSSVPSLRCLVFGKHSKSEQHHSPHHGSSLGSANASRGHSSKAEKCRTRRGCGGRAEIQRNFSTKSLIVNGNAAVCSAASFPVLGFALLRAAVVAMEEVVLVKPNQVPSVHYV